MAMTASSARVTVPVAVAATSVAAAAPRSRLAGARQFVGAPVLPVRPLRVRAVRNLTVRAADEKFQVVQPLNGDPFIGSFETPVTSSPLVANFLSQLPAYRTGVSPLLRGVEVGLAHGFLLVGPFYKTGPLRNTSDALVAGTLSAAGLVLILSLCLSIYGQATFQSGAPTLKPKTLSGRELAGDALQTGEGWAGFAAGFLTGGLSGVVWAYFTLTQGWAYFS